MCPGNRQWCAFDLTAALLENIEFAGKESPGLPLVGILWLNERDKGEITG